MANKNDQNLPEQNQSIEHDELIGGIAEPERLDGPSNALEKLDSISKSNSAEQETANVLILKTSPAEKEPRSTNRLSTRVSRKSHTGGLTLEQIMIKQTKELQKQIMQFHVLGAQRDLNTQSDILQGRQCKPRSSKFDYDDVPNHVDILLFGPAGSGKSSLIKTWYRALHQTQALPDHLGSKLKIKAKNQNEGTLLYSDFVIKEAQYTDESQRLLGQKLKKGQRLYTNTSEIKIHDTRGQIWMDDREMSQLDLIIQGKVKEKSLVEQRNFRYAFLLWEFWKSDHELFSAEIKKNASSPGLEAKPHCVVFVFDGSMDEIPNGEEETKFYKDIIQMARERKYFYPQVVLTCQDKILNELLEESDSNESENVEQNSPRYDHINVADIKLENKNISPNSTQKRFSEFEQEQKLREIIDMKIEKVVLSLGISRSSVHFIENYKTDEESQNLQIDFKSLRLLHECLQQCEQYVHSNLKPKKTTSLCQIF